MGYQIELRHLEYFQAVAEELNYRKAAERLFISQPGLSRQIKQMEEILEVQLFHRTKRKVELTVAGTYLKDEVEYLFNHLEQTKQQLKMIEAGKEGELRIGFLGSAAHQAIPDLLIRLNKNFPGIQTTLEELSNHVQVELIQKDKLDLGFVRLARVPEDLKMKVIERDTFSLVVPLNHPVGAGNFEHVGQFKNESFILFTSDYSNLYYDKIMRICEDQGFTPRISHRSVHALTIFKLVESGLGVAIVPTSLKEGYNLGVRFLEIKDITQSTELSVVWKPANRNPALKRAISMLLQNKII